MGTAGDRGGKTRETLRDRGENGSTRDGAHCVENRCVGGAVAGVYRAHAKAHANAVLTVSASVNANVDANATAALKALPYLSSMLSLPYLPNPSEPTYLSYLPYLISLPLLSIHTTIPTVIGAYRRQCGITREPG